MSKTSFIFAFIVLTVLRGDNLLAQNTNLDLCDIIGYSLTIKSTDSIDNLLAIHKDSISKEDLAQLYSIRGRLHVELNKKDIKKRAEATHIKLKNAYQDLTRAVEVSDEENHKIKYTARRYFVLENYKPSYPDYKSDLKLLSENGYKKDRQGWGISLVTRYDGEFWLGAEVSVLSGFGPTYKVKDKAGKIIMKKNLTVSASGLIVGFARNLESELNDINFSLLRVEAPLFVDLLKFGYISSSEGVNEWYYRPELGIGYSYFQLSGAYNVFFDGEGAEALNKFQLNFRMKYTL